MTTEWIKCPPLGLFDYPPDNKDVLLGLEDGGVIMGWRHNDVWRTRNTCYGEYIETDAWPKVIYWMEIPPLPKFWNSVITHDDVVPLLLKGLK